MCDFLHTDTETVVEEPITDDPCFLSVLLIHGMEILFFISKPNLFSLKSHDLSDGKYVSNPNNTILLVIHSIVVRWILFFDIV